MKKAILSLFVCVAVMSAVQAASPVNGETPAKKTNAVQKNILSDRLPAKLLTSIKKDYKSYWITNLYREEANGKVSYHVTLENADQVVKLSAAPSTKWSIERVAAKDLAKL